MTAMASSAARSPVDQGRRRILGALPAVLLTSGLANVQPAIAQASLDVPSVNRAADDADLHSVLVWQAGRMKLERYRRSKDKPVNDWFTHEVAFGPDVLHDLRSISKRVVALLIGQAVARGQVNISTPVLDFYPSLSDLRRDGRDSIRVSHLLDMASGFELYFNSV
jgi:hypothetical protein